MAHKQNRPRASKIQREAAKGYLDHSKNITLLRQTAGALIALLLCFLRALSTRCRLGTSLFLFSWLRLGLRCRFGLGLATTVQSRRAGLGDLFIERLALDLGNLQLKSGGLARAIGTLITSCQQIEPNHPEKA